MASRQAKPRRHHRIRVEQKVTEGKKRIVTQTKPNTPQLSVKTKSVQASSKIDPLTFIEKALDQKWSQYQAALTQFQTKPTRPAVHNIRVAVRRLTPILDVTQKIIPQSIVNKARMKLKEEISSLSDLRDVQVQITTVRRILNEFPEFKALHKSLLRDEKFYLKRSKAVTSTAFTKSIESSVGRIKISLKARRSNMTPSTGQKKIEAAIDDGFALVTKRLNELNSADYRTIHRVRLAFKPFRYLLGTFHPLFPTIDKRRVATATSLARIMGNIQDCDVLMKNLVEYKWRNETQRKAMMEIWQETERRKIENTQRLLKSLKKFGELWKPIPQRETGQPTNLTTIYVLRHAIAAQRGDPAYPLDSDRPLTSKGVKRMRRIANGICSQGVKFDLILSSPYRRALETAFILAKQYRLGEAIQTSSLLTPEVNPSELITEIQSKYEACKNILLVGHEPQLSAFISTLTVGNMNGPLILKKGGLCKLQIGKRGEAKATLSWLLTPKQLVAMA